MSRSGIDTPHFRIEICGDCSLPGYLIVSSRRAENSVAELSEAAQRDLGAVLAVCIDAITQVLRPERVYTARFSERSAGVHFHLFPRTRELASAFRTAHPQDHEIDGPKLLSWARTTHSWSWPFEPPGASVQILEMIRKAGAAFGAGEPNHALHRTAAKRFSPVAQDPSDAALADSAPSRRQSVS